MAGLLGAVLAGGAARRFGSDKALALACGLPLIDHVIARLSGQCDMTVVVGRSHGDWASLPDRPIGRMGPLAGLNAALHHAAAHGFEAVLCAPCDVPNLPIDLGVRLAAGPAVVADQPVIGLWPAHLAKILDDWLTSGERSVRGFADRVGARHVALGPLANINTPTDLANYSG